MDLWADGRSDEDQIGAPILNWNGQWLLMEIKITERQVIILKIYKRLNSINQHKIEPIPVCIIPENLKL